MVIREGTFFEEDETWDELGAALERGEPVSVNPKFDQGPPFEESVLDLPWRVGTRYDIHVYALHPNAPRDSKGRSDHDIPVTIGLGAFPVAREVAEHVVFAHNRLLRQHDGVRFDALTSGITPEELSLAIEQAFEPEQLELPFYEGEDARDRLQEES